MRKRSDTSIISLDMNMYIQVRKPHKCDESLHRNATALLINESTQGKQHISSHEGIKPYTCPTYDNSFTLKFNLKQHLKI